MATDFSEYVLKVCLAAAIGGFIGMEREYRSKAAGFRTMILITIGSTIFTMISLKLGGNGAEDRVAANVVTGIGFLGAGVVFKDGLTVSGLTTAASIWATASLGMAVGIGEYSLAFLGAVSVIIVLAFFEYVQIAVELVMHKHKYKIIFEKQKANSEQLEEELKKLKLKFVKRKELKQDEEIIYFYEINGSSEKVKLFNSYLIHKSDVKSFDA
jgi:putative Mg2+ transporter-C (MgtC) family protein